MTETSNFIKKTRLAVYTVLVGQKESLNDPLQIIGNESSTDLEIDFYCFTDKLQYESKTWQFRSYDNPLVPPEKASRLPKACPDKFFPEYDYSLYIDNTVVFKRLPTLDDIKGATFKGFRHPWRSCPTDEADIVVKSGLDDGGVVAIQMQFYEERRKISTIKRLTAGTVLLRKHNEKNIKNFGNLWWEQILLFSKRDQLSIDLCAQEAGCTVEYFPGDKLTNDLFLWPVIINGHRVLGSFDADYYSWENKIHAEAVLNPRQHYLDNKNFDSNKFIKKVFMFDYVCSRTKSSLGKIFSPRRGISDVIEKNLIDEIKPNKILIIGIQSDKLEAVDEHELIAAENAFKQYYRFEGLPKIVSSLIQEKDVVDSAQYLHAYKANDYDLIIVLGLTELCKKNGLAKFIKLLNTDGSLITEFGASLSMQEILNMHSEVSYCGHLKIFHGQHVSLPTIIPSSVFIFKNNSLA